MVIILQHNKVQFNVQFQNWMKQTRKIYINIHRGLQSSKIKIDLELDEQQIQKYMP